MCPINSPFPGGPGRTTTPETFSSLVSGLEERIFGRLPDATWIYPGHGYDTTLGAERPHLAGWRARQRALVAARGEHEFCVTEQDLVSVLGRFGAGCLSGTGCDRRW